MKRIRVAELSAGKMTVLFLAVAALSAFALAWMGVRLLQLERALESQQLAERREAAADRVVATLEQMLAAEERQLDEPAAVHDRPDVADALILTASPGQIRVWPENALLYYPEMPPTREAAPALFATADRAEFQEVNYANAVEALRGFLKAGDPAVGVSARLRTARNLRKAGRRAEALDIYRAVAKASAGRPIACAGMPADLAARSGLCSTLEEMGDRDRLRTEASDLQRDLQRGCWRLDRPAYILYKDQVEAWLGGRADVSSGQALAEAAAWLWRTWNSGRSAGSSYSGRKAMNESGVSTTVLWRGPADRLTALVAGPGYQKEKWFNPLPKNMDLRGVRVSLLDSDYVAALGDRPTRGNPVSSRTASAAGLPWTVAVSTADAAADLNHFAQRRKLVIAGLGMLALLVIAAGFLVGQSVARELAAARLKSDFVSAVSHEFRTPLTSMRQFTEILVEDDNLASEQRRSFYSAQERATRRLSRLVESLLDFGRMEAGARPYRLEPLDASSLVRVVVNEFRQEAGCKGFDIQCAVPDAVAMVNGDSEALAQAIWNLLDNGVKYSGDSRWVRVEVNSGSSVAIRVCDRGLGIPGPEQRQILRKFTRGSNAEALGIKGTGIGLAMVRHIADAHGGRLRVESTPGKGSIFTIELPKAHLEGSKGLRAAL